MLHLWTSPHRKRARKQMSTYGRSRSWDSWSRLCNSALRLQDMSTSQTCRRVCSGLAWRGFSGRVGWGWAGLGSEGSSFPLPFGSSQAASFGKCFLDRFPPDSFVRMCQDLRVLNAIRDYHIGIPLTYSQYPQACHEGVYSWAWQGKGQEMWSADPWQTGLTPIGSLTKENTDTSSSPSRCCWTGTEAQGCCRGARVGSSTALCGVLWVLLLT